MSVSQRQPDVTLEAVTPAERRAILDPNRDPGDRYGKTIRLTRSGDIAFDARGRTDLVYDEDAVIQALKVALKTAEGTDPFRPEYGLNIFRAIGTSVPETSDEVKRTIGPDQDGRVRQLRSVDIDTTEGREHVDILVRVTLREGEVRDFVFPLRERVGYLDELVDQYGFDTERQPNDNPRR